MTRSISLAVFFVVILVGVFWLTTSKGSRENTPEDSAMRTMSPRVQIVSPERDGGMPKFQLAISTDPGSLSQMNREASAVASRAKDSVVLILTTYKASAAGKTSRKSSQEDPRIWSSTGVVVGNGDEILGVIPPGITPLDVHIHFQDGSEVKADFIGRDDASEIALFRLPSAAGAKPLVWRNRRTLEWGEHFFAVARNAVHGAQMFRVMVSGDAFLPPEQNKNPNLHYRQLDQILPPDFEGAVLLDGDGQVAGMIIQPDAPDQLRAVVLDGGAVRVAAEALRSLQKQE